MTPRHAALLAPVILIAAGLVLAAASWAGRCGDQACRADIALSGHAEPQPIRRGEKTELKITPKNQGPDAAKDVEVHVDVHRKLKIKRARTFGGHGCQVSGTFVQCKMGDFSNQQLGVVRIKVKGKKKGTFVSQARAFAYDIEDPNGGNAQVDITVGVLGRR